MAHTEREPVYTVTSAKASSAADKAHRQKQYLTMMGVRVCCFGLVFITTGWLRWAAIIAAVLLPYFAVVLANAVRPREAGVVTPVTPQGPPRIER